MADLCEATGCEILGKAEFMNPGGSVKDRAACGSFASTRSAARCARGGTVVEGTAGNTGIGIAHICNARNYQCVIYMPDNQSPEKVDILRTLGAEVRVVKTVPYADEANYQKQAGRACRDARQRRLGQPVRQPRQYPRPLRIHRT